MMHSDESHPPLSHRRRGTEHNFQQNERNSSSHSTALVLLLFQGVSIYLIYRNVKFLTKLEKVLKMFS